MGFETEGLFTTAFLPAGVGFLGGLTAAGGLVVERRATDVFVRLDVFFALPLGVLAEVRGLPFVAGAGGLVVGRVVLADGALGTTLSLETGPEVTAPVVLGWVDLGASFAGVGATGGATLGTFFIADEGVEWDVVLGWRSIL